MRLRSCFSYTGRFPRRNGILSRSALSDGIVHPKKHLGRYVFDWHPKEYALRGVLAFLMCFFLFESLDAENPTILMLQRCSTTYMVDDSEM